jgi:glutaredoxin
MIVGRATQIFGADWCPDCRRTKSWLRRHDVPFTSYDTEADPSLRERAAAIAGGRTGIPVVVTPDGTVLVEPSSRDLASAFAGTTRRERRSGCR